MGMPLTSMCCALGTVGASGGHTRRAGGRINGSGYTRARDGQTRPVHHDRRTGRVRQDDPGGAAGERLRAAGRPVVVTREPGGTRLGEQLREILLARHGGVEATDALTDAFLFEAARRHLVRQVIGRPSNEAIVVWPLLRLDIRLPGLRRRVPLETLRALDEAATEGLRPDLTILLDLPAEAASPAWRRTT